MTQRTDPRIVSGALSMVNQQRWGLKGNVVDMVRMLTVDAGGDWAEISRRDATAWLHCGDGHTRRLFDELLAERVLERRKLGGQRGTLWRFRDPREWRRVPWRFRDRAGGDGAPELVVRRLDELAKPVPPADQAVVVLFDAQKRPTKQNVGWGQVRRRSHNLGDLGRSTGDSGPTLINDAGSDCAWRGPTNDDGASSTSREPTGSAAARERSEKTEEAGCAGRGDRTLDGAAEEVRRAIVRTGTGPVKGKLLAKLERGFRGVSLDLLGPVLAAIERAGRDGQRPPSLVDMAVDMIAAGATSITPARSGKSPDVVLAELYDQEDALKRDLADAEADGDEWAHVAQSFREQLAICQDRIARIIGEEASA